MLLHRERGRLVRTDVAKHRYKLLNTRIDELLSFAPGKRADERFQFLM
jgi:hypothetical protein